MGRRRSRKVYVIGGYYYSPAQGQGNYLSIRVSTGEDDLEVEGWRLAPDSPLPLTAGWHWIGYLPEVAQPLPAALSSIEGKYSYVVGETGAYAPPPAPWYLNTLSEMKPGAAYLIRMTEDAVLTYSP